MATALEKTSATASDQAISSLIRVDGIRHSYGQRAALKGISFDVRAGEIFGLLGPNGSGKTTLFRILSTLMLPTGGQAMIAGFDVANQPDQVRRRIGVVFQAKSIDIKLSAAENLWHQGHLYGLRGAVLQSRIQEMLQRVALLDRAKDRVETFSGGMQRRVELAKGLMHRPSVLLLDEPTTGLDPGARRDLWLYLDELRRQENVAIIVTTHLMEEAERCDRLAILSSGEIVGLGTPAELRSEIGGDVVMLETADPARLADRIQERFGISATVLENKVRMEIRDGLKFVTSLAETFPGAIQSVSISKPTLDDVFISRTGHRFWAENEKEEQE
jgi:ABC-2 type transport system ATP-binding protein